MEYLALGIAAFVGWILALGVFGWLLPIVCFLIIFPLEERDHPGYAFLALLGMFIFLYALTGFNPLITARDWWKSAVTFLVVWFATGSGWSVFMWNKTAKFYSQEAKKEFAKFVSDWKRKLRDHNPESQSVDRDLINLGLALQPVETDNGNRRHGQSFQQSAPDPERSTKLETAKKAREAALVELDKNEIPEVLMHKWGENKYASKPLAINHKEKITTWIVFWLWSALAYALTDLLSDAIDWIIERLSGLYARITEMHYAGMDTKYFK